MTLAAPRHQRAQGEATTHISYVDPATVTDPELLAIMDRARSQASTATGWERP
jgi:hypothetical protein